MKKSSKSFRLPEDVIDFVNQWPGESLTEKLVRLLRAEMCKDVLDLEYAASLDRYIQHKFRVAQCFDDLIQGSYDMIYEFYKYGFVSDDSRKFLEHLMDQFPRTEQEAFQPFGDLGPPSIYRSATAPARKGSGDLSQEDRGIPQPCPLGEDMPRKPLDGSLTDHPGTPGGGQQSAPLPASGEDGSGRSPE